MPGTVLGACKVKMKRDMVMAIKEAESKTMHWMWEERTFQVEGVTLEKGWRWAVKQVSIWSHAFWEEVDLVQ